MKIAIHAVSAKSGGAQTYLLNVAQRLSSQGSRHRYLLFVPPHVAKELCGRWENVAAISTRVGFMPGFLRFLWDQWVLRRILRRERVDVLLSSSDFGLFFPPCPQVLMVRNPLFFSPLYLKEILPTKSAWFRVEFFLRRWIVILSAAFSDAVCTASQSISDDLSRSASIPKEKVLVNPFGISMERFSQTSRNGAEVENPFQILYVSEYGDYKNLSTLLEAALLLRRGGEDGFRLTTTAHPDQSPHVESASRFLEKKLINDPLLAGHLHFAGAVSYQKVEGLYREADLFVFPSLAESFGHPLVEAMACGVPVLASDIPICREVCAQAALYFNPKDPRDLADKILFLRENLPLRRQLSEAGRERVRLNFRWDRHVQRLLEVLEGAGTKRFSYEGEKAYYSPAWPKAAVGYLHLEPYLSHWLDSKEAFSGKQVLDIGAGECIYARFIAERCSPKAVTACDLFHRRMLPASRANRNPRLRFVAGDGYRLPFQAGSFEAVFGSFILSQLPDVDKAIGEIHRVLKEEGCYVGIEPNPYYPVHLARFFLGRHSPNQYLFGRKELALFEKADFQIQSQYFYAKTPWLRGRFLGTCTVFVARRVGSNGKP